MRSETDRRRGEGDAMARATFRDPVGFEEEIRALQRDIARKLVNAPTLPIDLPAFDLTLLSVTAARNRIELVLGKSEPIAKLALTGNGGGATGQAVRVDIVDIHATAARYRPQLAVMCERLGTAISSEKWQRALEPASRLARLPVGVPLAFFRQLVPGTPGQGLIRTGFNCNQDCGMCWQDRTWGRFDAEQILTWIEDLRAAGARQLIISGGEPTLDANLADYIRRARGLGMNGVTLETNAIRFVRPGLAEHLRDAGLGDCFVSLHSGDAATSDAITRAPGTFGRTVAGIKALLAAGVPVRLNCVMTREGIDHLEGVPAFIHAEFGGHPALRGLMLSQPTDPFDPALLRSIVPEPPRLRSILPAVIDRAVALGIAVSGLDGPCGPPLCAFGADRRVTALAPIAERLAGRMYLAACAECAVRDACYGVRAADVALYGDACVQPLATPPAPA